MDIDISDPHDEMLAALREEHGDGIDDYLASRVEAEIHESYQQMRSD